MKQNWIDHYDTLEVSHLAAHDVIEARFRALCKTFHPDVNPAPDAEERMKQINLAWDILKDEQKRSVFHKEWMLRNRLSPLPSPAPARKPPVLSGVPLPLRRRWNRAGRSRNISTPSWRSGMATPMPA